MVADIVEEILDAIRGDERVRDAIRALFEEESVARQRVRLADCVDEQILVELERQWNRMDPTNAFGLYESLKQENPKAWVSPEVSIRMFRSVEIVARQAYNEATRM